MSWAFWIFIFHFHELLRQKGVELGREYRLLEVCNPKAAKEALDKDPKVGLLLPCTIAIYVDGSITRISLLRPSMLLNLIPESKLTNLGAEAEQKTQGCY